MTICRYYLMIAKDDQAEALRAVLVDLASKVKPLDGCEGVELFQDGKAPERYHFIERWTSVDAHKAAGQLLGKESFAPVMAVLADPPAGTYWVPQPL